MSAAAKEDGGLSMQSLLIASAASMAAAIVIHEVWRPGAILGAAVTPVIVALVSEALRKPVTRVSTLREQRGLGRTTTQERRQAAPTAAAPAEDRFGIWEAERREPWHRRLDRRHARLALVTGVLAFAVGAFALTGAELVLGGNVGSGAKSTTLVGGKDERSSDGQDDTKDEQAVPSTTAPADEDGAPDAPATTVPPATTAPPATTPEPETPAPAPTDPVPDGAPAPEGGAPAPETPAPAG